MIIFKNLNNEKPYVKLKKLYDKALEANQDLIEAVSISSFSAEKNEVDARFVNLKIVENTQFIFFSNYKSPKSKQFKSHNQILALIHWPSIGVQIRMNCLIEKSSSEFSDLYFKGRSAKKNALAISSAQSSEIDSYESVIDKYNKVLEKENLIKRPEYWGGFSFTPFYFEFWEGNEYRLNKREVYKLFGNNWTKSILEP